MSNLDTAKALYAAFNAHNMPGILELLDPDIEWNSFGPDFALAIGHFKGIDGVKDFFEKLVGPDTGQQVDTLFYPMQYFVSPESIHVMGIEQGYFTERVLDGAANGGPFNNNFDHTIWFNEDGKIGRFRANYNLSRKAPLFWPSDPGVPKAP